MRFSHARNPKVYSYKINDSVLQETKSHSYLGVTLASDLTWNEHINQISSTANRTLAFIMRNLNQCPQNIKSNAYKSLVRPLLEYSSSVWDPHTKKLSCKIDSVQRRAARFCFNDFRSKSEGAVSDMINKLEWEPLANRRMARRLVIFHKALHGHLSIPLDNLAQPANRISRHNNSRAFNNPTTTKDCCRYSFFPKTIRDWNNLPDSIVTIQDNNKFKEAINRHISTRLD